MARLHQGRLPTPPKINSLVVLAAALKNLLASDKPEFHATRPHLVYDLDPDKPLKHRDSARSSKTKVAYKEVPHFRLVVRDRSRYPGNKLREIRAQELNYLGETQR